MEIEFNPSRVPMPESSQPVVRQSTASSAASDPASFPTASSLQTKLNDIPLVRQDKMDSVAPLVSDSTYPPGYLVDRIAALLALHIKK
jgi:hypothetical protein